MAAASGLAASEICGPRYCFDRFREEQAERGGTQGLTKSKLDKIAYLTFGYQQFNLEMNQIRFHIAGSKTKFRSKFKDIIFV